MIAGKSKKIFIIWGQEAELSRYLALGLGAELKSVYHKNIFGLNLPWPLRYLTQSLATLFILFNERPGIVIVQNPPVLAPFVALLYCRLFNSKLAIDSHTAAFLDYKWQKFDWLYKFVAKQAAVNSCHNYKNLEILKKWGIEPSMVMQFFNPVYDLNKLARPLNDLKIEKAIYKSKLPIMMVNRFAADDDWKTVVATARIMPETDFFITGNPADVKGELGDLPANVYLTGYLKNQEFLKLMSLVKVVLTFSLRPDTSLWSIRETMALTKPFVTSDSEVLRRNFESVAIFSKSDPLEIKEKIIEALNQESEIKNKIKVFLEKDRQRWYNEIKQYNNFLNN